MNNYPIDIVVPWVDGSDPLWQDERRQYSPKANSDSSDSRYREWGLFQYWFRSIEKYAPWVRKVHLITWGHLPSWLNSNHPKLNIVNHKDYIPAEYLPTFSSHTIELNLHRIEGLAEHFIYFNDDVYLNAPTKPEDFFVNGVPKDSAVMSIVRISDNFSYLPYINLNMLGNINQTFSKRQAIKKNFFKWYNLKYGKNLIYNISSVIFSNMTGFKNFHTCIPYCKKTLEEVWENFEEALHNTCLNRFRSREDVNQYLFRYYRLMKGEFVPMRPNSSYLTIGEDSTEKIAAAFNKKNKKVICVNDDPFSCDFEETRKEVTEIFENAYKEVSSFEK